MRECYAKERCKKYPDCNKYCIGYIQLKNIYYFSNLPDKYKGEIKLKADRKDLKVYKRLNEIKEDILNQVHQGNGIFLYSASKGNGKTSWACKLLNEYFFNIALKNNLRCRGIFVNVPDFLQNIRKEINTETSEMNEFIENIKFADLVIWDDIGVEKPSDWVREQLYILINYRESNNLSQFYTSNLSIVELEDEKYLGGRITSRIHGQCEEFKFEGQDRR